MSFISFMKSFAFIAFTMSWRPEMLELIISSACSTSFMRFSRFFTLLSSSLILLQETAAKKAKDMAKIIFFIFRSV